MTKINESKKKLVDSYVKLFTDYPIVGAVNIENLPAPQFQNIRQSIRGDVVLVVGKRRLIKIAIDQCKNKKDIEKIKDYLEGMPALLFTNQDPFKLYKFLEKSKSKAPIKAGQTAPEDIWVRAGPTSFAPGPIISELGDCGIKSGVENGKIVVKSDSLVVEKGDVVDAAKAGILSKLDIKPMEVGLNIVAVYEDGIIYTKDILKVDEQEFIDNLAKAHQWAINLSVESGCLVKETVEIVLVKAFRESKAVALESGFMADAVAGELVGKAEAEMKALKEAIGPLEVKEAPKIEEAKPEEKKEEPKVEEAPKAEATEEVKPEEKAEVPVEEKKEEVKEEPKAEEMSEAKASEHDQKSPISDKSVEAPVVETKPEAEVPKEEAKPVEVSETSNVSDDAQKSPISDKPEKVPTASELAEKKPEVPKEPEVEKVPTATELAEKKAKADKQL